MSQTFGKADYVTGRSRKNPILVYPSRKDRSKVYEFMIAAKFKTPGLVSWKCVSCCKLKNGYRNLGAELKRKIPLILVDNDVIKEDPEKPLNAEHFCNGKQAVESVVNRAKLEFVNRHADDDLSERQIQATVQNFAREAATTTPIPLNQKEKRHVQKTLDANCLLLLHGVKKRRRICKAKQAIEQERQNEAAEQGTSETNEVPSTSRKNNETSSAKKSRKGNRREPLPPLPLYTHHHTPPPIMVRPLPPYYQRTIATQHLQHNQEQNHQRNEEPSEDDYYVEIMEDDDSQEPSSSFDREELIPADQQDVAYDIELQ